MIRFNNDYNHGAHPAILKALAATNDEAYEGYGLGKGKHAVRFCTSWSTSDEDVDALVADIAKLS